MPSVILHLYFILWQSPANIQSSAKRHPIASKGENWFIQMFLIKRKLHLVSIFSTNVSCNVLTVMSPFPLCWQVFACIHSFHFSLEKKKKVDRETIWVLNVKIWWLSDIPVKREQIGIFDIFKHIITYTRTVYLSRQTAMVIDISVCVHRCAF